ncbi:MAG: hypothetical protein NNA20_01130 [Nitrospira sp.]|nr:hypothetical protein [Nitrospira sp.]
MSAFTESDVESAALAWLRALGWMVAHGPDISPGGDALTLALSQRERKRYGEVLLAMRLRDALLPKLISGELRLPAALRERAAQAGVKDAEGFFNRRGEA